MRSRALLLGKSKGDEVEGGRWSGIDRRGRGRVTTEGEHGGRI